MKRFVPIALLVAVAACQDTREPTGVESGPISPSLTPLTVRSQAVEQVMPGRVLARLQAGVAPAAVASAHGLTVAGQGYRNAFVILRGAAGSERALASQLRGDARVVWAEPDYVRQPTVDPRLWAFYNPGSLAIQFTRGRSKGQNVSDFLSTEDADEDNLDNYAAGGVDVTVGSIDTGVEFGHPEFGAGQLIAGQDWYSGDSDPSDENGHGTHTTGTMAGSTVGVAGVAGAGPHVKVLVQRVCGPLGCPSSAIASAIQAAADAGVVAMNVSIGGSSESSAEKEAISYAVTKNSLVIASAGNDATGTISCPACDDNAISVAASNWQDALTYYTNFGPGLDLTAPGGQLYSNTTEQSGIYSAYLGGGYRFLQGTSMAAPQVTGTAGIVASKNLSLRGAALRSRILGTADDLGHDGYETTFGCGRLNSYRAVTGSTLPLEGDPNSYVSIGTCNGGTTGGGGNGSLTASFTYSCGGSATCQFDGSSSTGAISWGWAFGDGSSDNGPSVSHTFAGAGNYTVTLTVGDESAGTDQTSRTVKCALRGPNLRCS